VTKHLHQGIIFGLVVLLFCLIGRFASVVPLSGLSNAIKTSVAKRLPRESDHIITWKHMFMMWHSGLRGGISLVLVLDLGEWVDVDEHSGAKDMMVNGTFVVVVLYLLIFGSTTGPCLRLLGLPLGDQVPEGCRLYEKSDKQGSAWMALKFLRNRVFRPLLVGSPGEAANDAEKADSVDVEGPRVASQFALHSSRFSFADVILSTESGDFGPGQITDDVRRASILSLFGTMDPTHHDVFDSPARRASARSKQTTPDCELGTGGGQSGAPGSSLSWQHSSPSTLDL